jgi:hypothetical protein
MNLSITDFQTIVNSKTSLKIKVYTIILLIIITILFLISFNYKYYKYDSYLSIVGMDSSYYISLYVLDKDIYSVTNSKIYFEDKEIKVKNVIISEEYYLSDLKPYKLVKIYTDLDMPNLVINNVVNIKVKHEKTTIIKEIKKGLDL